MQRQGSITLTCLGCLGFLAALVVVGWLRPGGGGGGRVPAPDPQAEFSLDCSLESKKCRLEVSRKLARVQILEKHRRAIYVLSQGSHRTEPQPMTPGWLVQDSDRSFIVVSNERLQNLAQSGLGQPLRDIWDERGESQHRRLMESLLPPSNRLSGPLSQGGSLSTMQGPRWLEQRTLQLTYARRVMGSGVIAIPVGWTYFQQAYAPDLGLVLNSQKSERGAESAPDEALFANIPLSNFQREQFEPAHFEPPTGYRESWTDQELREATPHTSFSTSPPRDYRLIGTSEVSRVKWNDRRVTLIRENYLQKNSQPQHWKFEIFVYHLESPRQIDDFVKFLDLGFREFKSWDSKARAADATASLKNGLLLKKKKILVRLDMEYYVQGKPIAHPPVPKLRQELETLAREISQGLP